MCIQIEKILLILFGMKSDTLHILRYLDRTWILDPLTHSSLSVCHLYTPDCAIKVKGHFEE